MLSLPAQATFHWPDTRTGFAVKTQGNVGIALTKSVELHQWNFGDRSDYWQKLGTWVFDFGIGNDIVFVNLSHIIVEVVEIAIGIYWGYDFSDKGFEVGLIIGAISF